MKSTVKKMLVLALALMMLLPMPALAANGNSEAVSDVETRTGITPMAIILETVYQNVSGTMYKRRWNRTSGVWYDAYWVPITDPFPGPW